LAVTGGATLASTLAVTGGATLSSILDVTKATTLKDTLTVSQGTTLNSSLFVNGNSILASDVSINGDVTIKGNLEVRLQQNTSIFNTTVNDYSLIVTEDLSLNGVLLVSQDASLNGELYVKNNAIFDSSLNVNGETNFQYENTTQLSSSINISYDSSIDVSYNGVNFAPLNVAYSGDGSKLLYSNKNYTATSGIAYIALGAEFVTTSSGYGYSIATNSDGKFTIVGNPHNGRGTIYVYYEGEFKFGVDGEYHNNNNYGGEYFGYSVSITSDGSYCATGDFIYESTDNTDHTDAGKVYVYEIEYNPVWNLKQIATIETTTGENHSNSDIFGQSVSIICDSTDIYVSSGAVNYEPNSELNTDSNYGLVRTTKITKSNGASSQFGQDITGSYNLRKEGRHVNLVFRDDNTLRLATSTDYNYITIYDIDKSAGANTSWTKKNTIDISLPTITNIALNRGTSDVSGGDTLVVSNEYGGYIYDVRQASIDYFETKNISIQPVSITQNNTSISITDDGSKVAVGHSTSNNILVVNLNYSSPVVDTQITASTDGFYIKKMVNTIDYQNIGQHNMQLRIENGMGIYHSKALEIGLLENGTGIIQANEKDVGYNTLLLNPLGGNVGIGSGNVGIGTTQSTSKLHIYEPTGTLHAANGVGSLVIEHGDIGGSSSIVFPSAKNRTSDYGYIKYQDDYANSTGSERALLTIGTQNDSDDNIAIMPSGSVGINKLDPSISYKLDVNGDVNATSYNASSDYRIKENVVPISDTSYNIDNIRPVTYTNTKMEKQDFGVIAHELQEQIPFLVTGEKDGEHHQSVNYNGLIGLLLNEVQQLKKRVQELEQSKP